MILRYFFTLILGSGSLYCFAVEPLDSLSKASNLEITDTLNDTNTKIIALQEVLVDGSDRFPIEDGVAFIPDKIAKQLATDATSLIQNMHINELRYNPLDETIETVSGLPIAYFIDGQPASENALRSINTRDVLRVEYLRNPTNLKYQGNIEVVNFVLRHYQAGGVTKLGADQAYSGFYYLSQRVDYERMRFDGFFDFNYNNTNMHGSENVKNYKNIEYLETEYDKITVPEYYDYAKKKNRGLDASISANYSSDKITNQTLIEWSWTGGPGSLLQVDTQYEPDVIYSPYYISKSRVRSISPSLDNTLNIELPHDQSIYLTITLRHGHFNTKNSYNPNDLAEIINNSVSNQYSFRFGGAYSKKIGKNILEVSFADSKILSRIKYEGSTNSLSRTTYHTNNLFLSYTFQWKRGNLNLVGGIKRDESKVDGLKNETWTPRYLLSLSQNTRNAGTFTFFSQLSDIMFPSNMLNDIRIRSSELFWIEGNPNLKPRQYMNFILSHNKTYGNKFSLGSTILWATTKREPVFRWFTEPGYDGVIQQLDQNNTEKRLNISLTGTLRLLKKSLVFSGNVSWTLYNLRGNYKIDKNWWKGNFSANYYLKSFNFGLFLDSGTSSISGIEHTVNPMRYGINAGWGNSQWSIRINARDMFRKSNVRYYSYIDTPNFSEWSKVMSQNGGPFYYINITYTVGYGKKTKSTNMTESVKNSMTNNALNSQ